MLRCSTKLFYNAKIEFFLKSLEFLTNSIELNLKILFHVRTKLNIKYLYFVFTYFWEAERLFKSSASPSFSENFDYIKAFHFSCCSRKCYRRNINWFICPRLLSCRYGFMTINILRRKLLSSHESVNHSQISLHLIQSFSFWFSGCSVLRSASANKITSSRRSFEKIKFRKINWIKFSSEALCYLYKNLNLFSFHVLLLFFPFLCYPKLHMKESHWKFI